MIEFELLRVGHCTHPECIAARGGKFSAVEFPALVGLIKHPTQGYMLYDTGYSEHFFSATKKLPQLLFRLITPVKIEECLKDQLLKRNIKPSDIKHVIISHFHSDHVSGLKDYPDAKFICFKDDYRYYKKMSTPKQLIHAFLNELVPKDFEARAVEAQDSPMVPTGIVGFEYGYDLFGDQSILGVSFEGHTEKQLGLIFKQPDHTYFLVADACWGIDFLEKNMKPSFIADIIIANKKNYDVVFDKLRIVHQNPKIKIIPAHCQKTWLREKKR